MKEAHDEEARERNVHDNGNEWTANMPNDIQFKEKFFPSLAQKHRHHHHFHHKNLM